MHGDPNDSMLSKIIAHFEIPGTLTDASRFGNGLINDTFLVTFLNSSSEKRYVLQRINHDVFRDPASLMGNVERVCQHVRSRLEKESACELERRSLSLLKTATGHTWHREPSSDPATTAPSYWRMFHFIEGCTSHEVVETAHQAYHAARKFGEFQRLVADLDATRLHETIPDFHHTPKRYLALINAIQLDPLKRASHCADEIQFAKSRETVAHHLLNLHRRGLIPERVTHNDTKLSNVLMDDKTGEGKCVVDLDTVMPGLSLYDFGDLVRTCVSPVEEDSTDLHAISVRMPIFQALAKGFLEEMSTVFTPCEAANLAFAGKLLTYEVGLRFLTDHILGDPYFGSKRPNHNLERARNQFQLVRCLESHEAEMDHIVDEMVGSAASADFRLKALPS